MPADLDALIRSRFPSDRSAPCLEREDGRVDSYADLDRAAARIARLLAGLGVRRGDRVAAQVEKSPEAVYLYLGVLRAGAVYLPLNPAYTLPEVEYFLADAEPAAVVCRPESQEAFALLCGKLGVPHLLTLGARGDGSLLERCAGLTADLPRPPLEADDLAAILYTSGTTGRAKGAMLTHGNLAANGLALCELWGFGPGDVLLHALPIFHAHGLFVALHCTLLAGARLLFLPRFDADAVMERLPRATVLMGVPTFYTRLLAEPGLTREACARMRLFISGSASLLAETHVEFEARTGHRIVERYGMSETLITLSNPLRGERKAGTVGKPIAGVLMRVVDDELQVGGPGVMRGYWNNAAATAAAFTDDGFLRTGDAAAVDDDGYVTIRGRLSSDFVKVGGYKVSTREVEDAVASLAGIREVAVVGVPDREWGERVVACVVVEEPLRSLDAEALLARVQQHVQLQSAKKPRAVVVVDALPRNAMGKLQKKRLAEQVQAVLAQSS